MRIHRTPALIACNLQHLQVIYGEQRELPPSTNKVCRPRPSVDVLSLHGNSQERASVRVVNLLQVLRAPAKGWRKGLSPHSHFSQMQEPTGCNHQYFRLICQVPYRTQKRELIRNGNQNVHYQIYQCQAEIWVRQQTVFAASKCTWLSPCIKARDWCSPMGIWPLFSLQFH